MNNTYKKLIDLGILPKTQKAQAKIFGVRESTLNTWINVKKCFPQYAINQMNLLVEVEKLNKKIDLLKSIEHSTTITEHKGLWLVIDTWLDPDSLEMVSSVMCECTALDTAEVIQQGIKINL
jgi:hypothetical protein